MQPWLKYKRRDLLYREAVLAFLGCGRSDTPEDKYCQVCRELGEDDCDNCDRESIEVLSDA